jgi:hypothetical protein
MSDPLHERIRTILLEDWDPTNASRSEYARHEYDSYIPSLITLIRSRATEDEVIDHLYAIEREIMCFPGLDKERLRRPARRLLNAVTGHAPH